MQLVDSNQLFTLLFAHGRQLSLRVAQSSRALRDLRLGDAKLGRHRTNVVVLPLNLVYKRD